jgi:cyclophilin family peptidyl-prolyl cis-trans isomerase
MANDGDVASGCWTEDQRTSSEAQPLQWTAPPQTIIDPGLQYTAVLDTNYGQITWQLLNEVAPITVNNFVCLSRAGYYTNVPFHRIVADFVIQGGDPTGTGSGGPGYQFTDEPVQGEYLPGIVAMANAGPNTNGSQFFIIIADLTQRLGKQYNLFARVIDGQATVDAIAAVPTDVNPNSGEQSVPLEPVTLNSVTVFVH